MSTCVLVQIPGAGRVSQHHQEKGQTFIGAVVLVELRG